MVQVLSEQNFYRSKEARFYKSYKEYLFEEFSKYWERYTSDEWCYILTEHLFSDELRAVIKGCESYEAELKTTPRKHSLLEYILSKAGRNV